MAKTIHIHLPPGMVVTRTTRDSGDWKESDHPRAKNGQFGSGGGGGSAPAAKEKGRQTSGTEGKQSLGKAELMKHPAANKADYDYLHRENGMSHEEIKARWDREHAKKNPPPAPAAKKSTAPSSGAPAKPQAPASSSGAPNWSASNGNWDKAKKEGRELVQAKLQEAKTGGDRTDALLALKKQAEVEHKKGSYLAAVVIGEVNDYFDRVK